MIAAVNRRVDDAVDTTDAIEGLNSGKNLLAIAVGANFPDLDPTNTHDTFVFDVKYHEAPVLYAAALIKEQDSAISEAANFMMKFESLKKDFIRFYVVPPRYRDDHLSQQFIATAAQTTFTVTKDGYNHSYGDLKVYVNNIIITAWTVNPDTSKPNDFVLTVPATAGDAVTALWEEHTDLIEPPYNWWNW